MSTSQFLPSMQRRLCIAFAAAAAIFSHLLSAPLHAQEGMVSGEERLRGHVRYLAGDELAGRRTGTPENLAGARYIAEQFRLAGLSPVGDSFLRDFTYTAGVEVREGAQLDIISDGRVLKGRQGIDFNGMGYGSDAAIRAPLLFVGYGITAEALKYDDYKGVNASQKVVVIMRYTPDGASPHGEFAHYGSFISKILNAREHGAVGVVFISPPGDSAVIPPVTLERNFSDIGIPVLFADSRLFDHIRDGKGRSLLDLRRRIDSTRKPASFLMPKTTAAISIDMEVVRERVPNVVGFLPGVDPTLREEIIVVGAHMDHLGWGGEGSLAAAPDSAIHHGADDNASGTAGMLLLAERMGESHRNRRSILFVAFNGEEEGLLGSAAFVDSFPFDLSKVVAMINFDMIGRLDSSKLIVQGTGTSPSWEPLVTAVNADRFSLSMVKEGLGPSDHSSFYNKGIPVLFFFTGLHADYHRPSDTWEKVNYRGLEQVVGFTREVIDSIDRMRVRPSFEKTPVTAATGGRGFRVYVGTIPDYGFSGRGLRLTGVAPDGPAEKGGLAEGDIIVRFAGREIANIYDFTAVLADLAPGQKVEVEYLRGEERRTVNIELAGR